MVSTSPTNNATQSMMPAKSLTLMEDQMNHESLACKKFEMYEQGCADPTLKSLCENAKKMHKKHFDVLFTYLNDHNKPQQ